MQVYSPLLILTGAVPRSNAAFGEGNGTILLSNVHCTGLEYRLFSCVHEGPPAQNCEHREDAGVVCQLGKQL
jgi:deleted-in-malignant-brain-tumors protein 1